MHARDNAAVQMVEQRSRKEAPRSCTFSVLVTMNPRVIATINPHMYDKKSQSLKMTYSEPQQSYGSNQLVPENRELMNH